MSLAISAFNSSSLLDCLGGAGCCCSHRNSNAKAVARSWLLSVPSPFQAPSRCCCSRSKAAPLETSRVRRSLLSRQSSGGLHPVQIVIAKIAGAAARINTLADPADGTLDCFFPLGNRRVVVARLLSGHANTRDAGKCHRAGALPRPRHIGSGAIGRLQPGPILER